MSEAGFGFNADEVFEMAEQIERNGAAFYRKAADDVTDEGYKKFLLHLAAMEDTHEITFKELRTGLTREEKGGDVYDPDGEAISYLQSLADTKIFFEREIDTASIEDILKSSITAEKDSIVFYLGMKELVSKELGKKKIDAIIKEEMSHVKILGTELLKLKK